MFLKDYLSLILKILLIYLVLISIKNIIYYDPSVWIQSSWWMVLGNKKGETPKKASKEELSNWLEFELRDEDKIRRELIKTITTERLGNIENMLGNIQENGLIIFVLSKFNKELWLSFIITFLIPLVLVTIINYSIIESEFLSTSGMYLFIKSIFENKEQLWTRDRIYKWSEDVSKNYSEELKIRKDCTNKLQDLWKKIDSSTLEYYIKFELLDELEESVDLNHKADLDVVMSNMNRITNKTYNILSTVNEGSLPLITSISIVKKLNRIDKDLWLIVCISFILPLLFIMMVNGIWIDLEAQSSCLFFITELVKDVFKRVSGLQMNNKFYNKDENIELTKMKKDNSEESIISLGDVLDRNKSNSDFIVNDAMERSTYRIEESSLESSNKENNPNISKSKELSKLDENQNFLKFDSLYEGETDSNGSISSNDDLIQWALLKIEKRKTIYNWLENIASHSHDFESFLDLSDSNKQDVESKLIEKDIDELGIFGIIIYPIMKNIKLENKINHKNIWLIINTIFIVWFIILIAYLSSEYLDLNQSGLFGLILKGVKEISNDLKFKILSCVSDCEYEPDDNIPRGRPYSVNQSNRTNTSGSTTLWDNPNSEQFEREQFDREEEAYYTGIETQYKNRYNWANVLNDSTFKSILPFLLPKEIWNKLITILKRILLAMSFRLLFGYLMSLITPWLGILGFIDITVIIGLLPTWIVTRLFTLSSLPVILEESPSTSKTADTTPSSPSQRVGSEKPLPHRPQSKVLPQLPIDRFSRTPRPPTHAEYNSWLLEQEINKSKMLRRTESWAIEQRMIRDGTSFIPNRYVGQSLSHEEKRILGLRRKGWTESQIFWSTEKITYSGIPHETVDATELPKKMSKFEIWKIQKENSRVLKEIERIKRYRQMMNNEFYSSQWVEETKLSKVKRWIKKIFKM